MVAKSSTESEYRSLSLAVTEVIWLQSLFSELNIKIEAIHVTWCDNTGAKALSTNPLFTQEQSISKLTFTSQEKRLQPKNLKLDMCPLSCRKLTLSATRLCFLRDLLSLETPQFNLRGIVSK